MRLSLLLFQAFRFLIPPCVIATVWLYSYPLIHGCSFPPAKRAETACYFDPQQARNAAPEELAPFRLLALGDPQLEGDTSLPDANAPLFPSLQALRDQLTSTPLSKAPASIAHALAELISKDVTGLARSYRKRLDLVGNDYYLAHIYRSVHWWTKPTHTVVLGDLLGSQWISDEEFARRSDRYWNRVFKGAERVPDDIAATISTHANAEVLDEKRWSKRVINVVGNHDIGYAGDLNEQRIERFESAFGRVNWEVRFKLPSNNSETSSSNPFSGGPHSPELRLVVLNSMNLDSPAWAPSAQQETYAFLAEQSAHALQQQPNDATILLTHIPLHKEAGICVDGPFFDYFPSGQGGGIKEQNHLSGESSTQILDGLYSSAETGQGIIINGHDHEGCNSYHYRNQTTFDTDDSPSMHAWSSVQYRDARPLVNDAGFHGVREVTVRSMMGDFGGNAGLLSGWFDKDAQQWKFEYATCVFGIPHFWWATHVLQLVLILLTLGTVAAALQEAYSDRLHSKQNTNGTILRKKNS